MDAPTLGPMALSTDERQAFLAEPHIGALSIAAGPDAAPLLIPIWYDYSPGGDLWFLTGARSRKVALLEAAGKCTMMVERWSPSIRYVSASGTVVSTTPATLADLSTMANRYLPAEAVGGYVSAASAGLPDQVRVTVRLDHWLGADMGRVS